MNKKFKIFFATAVDITILGAHRSIDIPMVQNMQNLGYDICWFGINLHKCGTYNGRRVSIERSSFQKFITKVINKLLRILNFQTLEQQKIIDQKKFDRWLAKKLNMLNHEIDENLIFIGRAVSSELSFKVVKKYRGVTILHSQWLHPLEHNKLMSDAFASRQINYKQILPERIAIQQREILISDKIWCISNLVLNSYIKNGLAKEDLILLPLGVDIERFMPSKNKLKDTSSEFVIVFVGNIGVEKGVDVLLSALLLSEAKHCRIILHGGVIDYFVSTLKALTEKLNSKGITVTFRTGDPYKSYAEADLFILPSLHESFGLTVLEAMASGLPIIVSNTVGASQHIIEGKNGFVVSPGSVSELADRINFFRSNRESCLVYGQSSRYIAANLDWPLVCNRFLSLLKEMQNAQARINK